MFRTDYNLQWIQIVKDTFYSLADSYGLWRGAQAELTKMLYVGMVMAYIMFDVKCLANTHGRMFNILFRLFVTAVKAISNDYS